MLLFIIIILAFLAIIRLLSYFLYVINCSYYFPYVMLVLYMLIFIAFRLIFFLSVKELSFEEIVKNKYKWDEVKKNSKAYKYLVLFSYICVGKSEAYYDRYFTKIFVLWQLHRYMFQLYTFTEWFSCVVAIKAKTFEIELKYFFYVVVYDYLEERYLFIVTGFSGAHRITFLIHVYNRYRKTRRVNKNVRFSRFYSKFRYVILHYSLIILWFCPAKNLYSYRWKTSFLEFKGNTLQRFLKETAEFIEMNPTTEIMSTIYDPIDQIPGDGNTFLPWPYFIDVSFRGSEYGDGDGNDEYDIYNLYMYDTEEFDEFEIDVEFGNGSYVWHTDDLLEGQTIKDLGYEEEYITLGMNEDEVPEYIPPFTEYFFDEVELLTRLDNDVVVNSYAVNISAVFLVFGFFVQIAFSIILLSRRLQIFLYLECYKSASLFVTIAFVYFVKFASGLTFFMFIVWFPLQLLNLNYLPWHIYFLLEIIVKYVFK